MEKRNGNDVVTNLISITTTLSGEIVTYLVIDKNMPAADEIPVITKEAAKQKVLEYLNSILKNGGYNVNNINIKETQKAVMENSLFWRFYVIYPGGDPKEPTEVHDYIFVNAKSGELKRF